MSHQNYGAQGAVLVTPSDVTTYNPPLRALSFSVAGAVEVTFTDGTNVTIPSGSLAAGIIHPVSAVSQVNAGTDAQDVVGWY